MAHKICPVCGKLILYDPDHDCTVYDFSNFSLELELHGLSLELDPYDPADDQDQLSYSRVSERSLIGAAKPGKAVPFFLRL